MQRLLDKLERSDNPKELLSNNGVKRFIAVEGDARLTVNPERESPRPSGGTGSPASPLICTTPSVSEVMAHYHGLWQVEGELPDHQARPEGAANLALEREPDPRPHRHRLHGLRLRPPPRVPRRHPEAADVPGSDPLSPRPPPMLGPALRAIGQPLRHPLKADAGGGTDLRNPWGCTWTITPYQLV